MPEYLGALHAAWLNESATLFRRRYYENGSHAGFILYTTDAAHRIPPQLMGIVPSNTGGFGAADTAAQVFGVNEIEPLQRRFAQINEWLGDEIVRFIPYTIGAAAA